ncbi:CPBP family intramembrane glutamic endopeptidase [Marivirga arenosa]|uniref:CPBP family intramembrane glutamic endopeptidase n=1 Tax=Marivirga arenosa TaxID=3059076 RepID=A0AA52EYB8_9BACT|nr:MULTISPECIES: CPBP family intramembrane glutamic endopeptidase [unclassified Marivirga]WMN08006.1 CPBP family intramembrane glutamic endopeptidase [Marivirga sp. ABR2-2]WNB17797.1 CPBP family intramembrane glutamic endopeptidase [Marivirga sp. BKB1-2]
MNSLKHNNPQIIYKNPWTSIFYLVLLFLAWNLISQLIGSGLAVLVSGVNIFESQEILQPPFGPESKLFMYVAQGVSHFLGFTLFGLFFIKKMDKQEFKDYFHSKKLSLNSALIIVLMTFSFMMFNSIIIEWNMNIEFPEFMKAFEEWARATEDQLMELTELLSNYDSFGEMLIALLIIGVLPAIGEELVFRGLLQNKLESATKNAHLAIWISAIIFGAFHMQFYGVVPRIMLGALFGYIYVFSRNIWYPIIAHFVNNGLAVILMYVGPRFIDDFDAQEVDSSVPVYISLSALFACLIFFRYFKQQMNKAAQE